MSLTRRSALGWTRMVGRVFTCVFGAQPRGIASLPARPPPLRPFSLLWGETSLGGGQRQSDSGSATGGVWGGVGGGGITHHVPGPGISRLRAA